MPLLSVDGRLNIWNFFIAVDLFSVVPLASAAGIMEDYDYLLENSDALSNYSKHDLYTDRHFNIMLKIGYSFFINNFEIEPVVGFSYYTRKWSAIDGFLQYPEDDNEPWTESVPQFNLSGTGISYEQLLRFPFFGLHCTYNIKDIFKVSLKALYYPYIWVEALDSHFIRLKQYYDTMEGGMGANVEISFIYYFNKLKKIGILASFNYEGLYTIRGTTSSNVIGISNGNFSDVSGYRSGTDGTIFSVKAGVVLQLDNTSPDH